MTGNILGAVESEEEASETDTHSEDEKMEGIRKEETTLSCQSRCTGEGPGSFDSGHYTAPALCWQSERSAANCFVA